jgi:hypothetical protein
MVCSVYLAQDTVQWQAFINSRQQNVGNTSAALLPASQEELGRDTASGGYRPENSATRVRTQVKLCRICGVQLGTKLDALEFSSELAFQPIEALS